MNKQNDWDPNHYLKFKNERTQPSIDLVNRINPVDSPKYIIDIGCGPGNSSQVLLQRWPKAKLIGLDNSPAMIEKAKIDYPDQEWVLADAINHQPKTKYDLIFSNATIQWIPDHQRLLETFFGWLSQNGVIAVQLPKFQDMLIGRIIEKVAKNDRFIKQTAGCSEIFTYHDYHYYYDLLTGKARSIDMWQTDYVHVMASHASIIDWVKSTGLKPYLDRMAEKR